MAPTKDKKTTRPTSGTKNAKTAPGGSAVRILSAKELRKRAFLIGPENIPKQGIPHAAPSGPPHAGIVDKVVECGECGFPVWCEHSQPATEETFERLKIATKGKKPFEPEEEYSDFDGDGEKKGEDGEEEEEEDLASLDTLERHELELERAHEKYEKLEIEFEKLLQEKDQLEEDWNDKKQKLAASEEKCEFLQASELNWREKYQNQRIQMEQLFLTDEIKSMKICDREAQIVKLRAERAKPLKDIALVVQHVDDVYNRLANARPDEDTKELMILQLHAWRQLVVIQQLHKEAEMSQGELAASVESTKTALAEERQRRRDAEETTERHKIMRWQVGRTVLVRLLQVTRIFRTRILWRGWLTAHQTVTVENRLSELEERHVHLQESNRASREQASMVVADILAKVADNAVEHMRTKEIIAHLGEDFLASVVRASQTRESEAKAAAELLQQTTEQLRKDFEATFEAAQKAWAEEKRKMSEHIDLLISSLPEDAEGQKRIKVVAQGKGVICVSCCKQLVHHNVMPLPPTSTDLPGASEGKLVPDVGFFAKELHSLLQAKKENVGGYPGSNTIPPPVSRMARPSSSPAAAAVRGRLAQMKGSGRPETAGGAGNDALRREVSLGSLLPGRPPGVGSRTLRTEINAFRQQASTAWR